MRSTSLAVAASLVVTRVAFAEPEHEHEVTEPGREDATTWSPAAVEVASSESPSGSPLPRGRAGAEEVRATDATGATFTDTRVSAAPAPQADRAAPSAALRSRSPSPAGIVLAGAGTASLATAVLFGARSFALRAAARSECDGDRCSALGVDRRDDSLRAGNIATLAGIGGAAALFGGVVLLLTSPSVTPVKAASSATRRAFVPLVAPSFLAGGASIALEGALP